jgi:hypothetical protein
MVYKPHSGEIVNIKASMNKGISFQPSLVKSHFAQINPVPRETVETIKISDPHWIAGFVSGEGNFDAGIRKATVTPHRGERVYLRFRLTQHKPGGRGYKIDGVNN